MIRFNALALILALIPMLALPSCGFSPVYGSKTGTGGVSAKEGLDRVDIALIPNEEGVYLRNLLIDNFYQNGYPSAPTHRLEILNFREIESDLDITINSEATRKQIKLTVDMVLKDKETGAETLRRALSSVTSFNVLGSQFATRISEKDAREAALNDLARQIENQVALYFKK